MTLGKILAYKSTVAPSADITLYPVSNAGNQKIYARQVTDPRTATLNYTVMTPDITINTDMYILLKGAAGTFGSELLYKIDTGEWKRAKIISGQIAILSVNIPTVGTKTVTVYDGVVTKTFTINAVSTGYAVGTYARMAIYYYQPYANVARKLIVEGTGMQNVASAVNGIVELTFKAITDNYLLIEGAGFATGNNDIVLKNASNTTLDTITINVTLDSNTNIEAFYSIKNNIINVYLESDLEIDLLYYLEGTSLINSDARILNVYQYETQSEELFTYIVRQKNGAVVPMAAYMITATDFVMNGYADRNGVISISKSLLPDVFTVNFIMYDLAYLNRTFVK